MYLLIVLLVVVLARALVWDGKQFHEKHLVSDDCIIKFIQRTVSDSSCCVRGAVDMTLISESNES